jgi:hypothetical protein
MPTGRYCRHIKTEKLHLKKELKSAQKAYYVWSISERVANIFCLQRKTFWFCVAAGTEV